MATLNLSLPDALESFVDKQVIKRGYATSGDYIFALISADQVRERLRKLLLDGATSNSTAAVDDGYFDSLKSRVSD